MKFEKLIIQSQKQLFNLVLHFVDFGLEATVGNFKDACSYDVS
jgi:hypothetical protein